MAIRSKTQRSLLLGFIASICLCGVVGIYCLLQGKLGSFEGRVLLSTAAVGAGSILALASAVSWEQRRWHLLGAVAMVVVGVSTAITVTFIWLDFWHSEWIWLPMAISWVCAVALPHLALLSLARLKSQWKVVRGICVGLIVLLACQIIASILWGISSDDWFRAMGVIAIGVTCGTISIPILHRVSRIQVREAVRTTELYLSITCPRCSKTQTLNVGHSKCAECGLKFQIEIEEENCAKCGYPLYKLESAACPECGTPILRPGLAASPVPAVPNSA
jgi:ribosomal protein L37E